MSGAPLGPWDASLNHLPSNKATIPKLRALSSTFHQGRCARQVSRPTSLQLHLCIVKHLYDMRAWQIVGETEDKRRQKDEGVTVVWNESCCVKAEASLSSFLHQISTNTDLLLDKKHGWQLPRGQIVSVHVKHSISFHFAIPWSANSLHWFHLRKIDERTMQRWKQLQSLNKECTESGFYLCRSDSQ